MSKGEMNNKSRSSSGSSNYFSDDTAFLPSHGADDSTFCGLNSSAVARICTLSKLSKIHNRRSFYRVSK
ncbi:hypothetical protein PHET_08501 [Paragonimus heterotremus]|uniref:Uncharacterized protein n=1 Tax=Paragonimus heterotremus TaxID=100268 RepID=A0A8J4WFT7_9TREM|nr:hypothetical protein PHET_08501 [Paragonimus heterotremus]